MLLLLGSRITSTRTPWTDTGADASGLHTLSLDYRANNVSFAGIYAAIDQCYDNGRSPASLDQQNA